MPEYRWKRFALLCQNDDISARALEVASFFVACFYLACFFGFLWTFFPSFGLFLDRGVFRSAAGDERGRGAALLRAEKTALVLTAPEAQRNLFKAPAPPQPARPVVASPSAASDIFAQMALVGIIADDGARAVLEDRKAGLTYFLSPGDMVADMKVVEIGEQEVVFENAQGRRRLTL